MGTPQKPLTDRQKEIYDYIRSCTEKEKMPPTVREIGDKFGISSTNGVRSILSALIKKGYIRRAARLSRGIEILNASATPLQRGEQPSAWHSSHLNFRSRFSSIINSAALKIIKRFFHK